MDTADKVREVLDKLEIDTEGIGEATRLREDLQIDSTELVEIAVALEAAVAVAIDTDKILTARTFADLVSFVDAAPAR